ncbi:MAG: single-stranded DNA-binding protein [Anaerolineaceae bacterium]|nr:single-stranded DNA-binding protein [Anaerolineaceae bacterium]
MTNRKPSLKDHLQEERRASAEAAIRLGKVSVLFLQEGVWIVKNRDRHYTIQRIEDEWSCNCPDFLARHDRLGLLCKHIQAVRFLYEHVNIGMEIEFNGSSNMSYHTIILVGRLGHDPELRYTPSGQFVTHFSVATNFYTTDEEGKPRQETTWFRVTAWSKTAEQCQLYLHKGNSVLVEGRLIADPETGGPREFKRPDGSAACAFEVNAAAVRFLSGPGPNRLENEEEREERPNLPTRKSERNERRQG